MTDEQITAIQSDDYMASPHLAPRERAAVLWAEHVAKNTAREHDDIFEAVKQHFDDAEFVELTGICAKFAFTNRMSDSLCLPIEEKSEVDKIKRSVKVDPDRIKTYIVSILEDWENEFPSTLERGRDRGAIQKAVNVDSRPTNAMRDARVPLLDPNTATGERARFFTAAEQLFGSVSNVVRVWAHIPYVAKQFFPLQVALEYEGVGGILPAKLKAMTRIKTAHVNAAPYTLAHASALARAAGATDAQIAAIGSADSHNSPALTPRERAAVLWAEHVALNTAKRRDDVFQKVKQQFSDAQFIELTCMCAFTNMEDRVHNALRIPLESAAEIAALNRTVSVDPERVRYYLETLVRNWPLQFPPAAAA